MDARETQSVNGTKAAWGKLTPGANLSPAIPPPDSHLLAYMIRKAGPLIVINMTMVVMQLADAIMVAHLGDETMAAIMPAGLLYFVPVAFAMGLLSAVNTFVSQCLGRRWREGCGIYGWQGIWLGAAFGVLMLPLIWVAPHVVALLGHEPDVQALEVEYFTAIIWCALPALVVTALSNFFVGIHRPKPLMNYALLAMVLNIPFNYMLIHGTGPLPEMGLAGAAWGTVIASFLQMAGLMMVYLNPKLRKHYRTERATLRWSAMRDILKVGSPAALHMGMDILSWGVALVWMVGFFGTLHLAATTILVRVVHLSFMPTLGVAAVLTALVGRAIGAKNQTLAKRYTRLAATLSVGYMGGFALFFYLAREPIMELFTDNPEVIAIGAAIMVYVAAFQIFDAVNIVYTHALRGAGDTLWPSLMNFSLCGIFFIAGGLWLCKTHPEMGSGAPWLAGASYITIAGLVFLARWYFGPWRKIVLIHADTNQKARLGIRS